MSMRKFAIGLAAACVRAAPPARRSPRAPSSASRSARPISRAWDINILPDGTDLPPGSGKAADGAKIFAEKCAACHGDNGKGGIAGELIGGPPKASLDGGKTIANFWPDATTLFDFIRRAMPYSAPRSLSDQEVYALTAYLLAANKLIGENDEINATDAAEGEDAEPGQFHHPLPGPDLRRAGRSRALRDTVVTGLVRPPRFQRHAICVEQFRRRSGAARSAEPGIQRASPFATEAWIPGSRESACPGMTCLKFTPPPAPSAPPPGSARRAPAKTAVAGASPCRPAPGCCRRWRRRRRRRTAPGRARARQLPTRATAVPISTSPGQCISPRKSIAIRASTKLVPGTVSPYSGPYRMMTRPDSRKVENTALLTWFWRSRSPKRMVSTVRCGKCSGRGIGRRAGLASFTGGSWERDPIDLNRVALQSLLF